MDARPSDETQCRALAAATVGQEAHASEAEDHHGPGGGLGDGTDRLETSDSDLLQIRERRAINRCERNLGHQLSVDTADGEEVMAVGLDREVVFEEAAVDVDALDVDNHAPICGGIDVKDGTGECVVGRQVERDLSQSNVPRTT